MWLRKKKNEISPAAEHSAGVKSEQTDSSYTGTGAGAIAGGDQNFTNIHFYNYNNRLSSHPTVQLSTLGSIIDNPNVITSPYFQTFLNMVGGPNTARLQ